MPVDPPSSRRKRPVLVYALLSLPFFGLLWPGLYAFEEPRLAGIPFFYWYQLLWVLLGSAVTLLALRIDSRSGKHHGR